MRLDSGVTESEVRAALEESSTRTWGEDRTRELSGALDKTAREITTVLQFHLAPTAEEPEYPAASVQPKDEG